MLAFYYHKRKIESIFFRNPKYFYLLLDSEFWLMYKFHITTLQNIWIFA